MGQSISEFEAWLRRNKSEQTISAYTLTIERFLRWLDGKRPTAKLVDDFISHLLTSGNKNSSAARHLAAVKSYFKFLGRKSELDDIEAPRVELGVPDYFTVDEFMDILGATESRMYKAMVAIQFNAGLRFIELQGIQTNDIDWENRGILFVPAKKRGMNAPTFIDLEEGTMDILEGYTRGRNDDRELLFCRSDGGPIGMKAYNKFLRDKCESIGIRPRSSHALRHGLATYLSENGVDIGWISIIMRHRNIGTTMRYNHARRDKVMAKTPRIFDRETEHVKKQV